MKTSFGSFSTPPICFGRSKRESALAGYCKQWANFAVLWTAGERWKYGQNVGALKLLDCISVFFFFYFHNLQFLLFMIIELLVYQLVDLITVTHSEWWPRSNNPDFKALCPSSTSSVISTTIVTWCGGGGQYRVLALLKFFPWLFRKQRWPVAEWIQSIGSVQMRLIEAPPLSGSMRSLGDDQKCVLRLCETRLPPSAVSLLLLLILVANNKLLNQRVATGNCVAVFCVLCQSKKVKTH